MPYLSETHTGDAARKAATAKKPFGPDLAIPGIETLEIWSSSFNDPGEDYNEFRAFDASKKLLSTVRISGY